MGPPDPSRGVRGPDLGSGGVKNGHFWAIFDPPGAKNGQKWVKNGSFLGPKWVILGPKTPILGDLGVVFLASHA